MNFEDMTEAEFHALTDQMTSEEAVEFFMQPGSLIPVLKYGKPPEDDVHFVLIDEDGRPVTSADWVARAEAGRPMMVRMAHMPPDPDEES